MHEEKDIIETFRRIDRGEISNAVFSHANVVMLTKNAYAALLDTTYPDVTDRNEPDIPSYETEGPYTCDEF